MSFMNSIGSAASSSASSTASSSASATASSIAPIVSTVVEKVSIKSSWVWEYFSTDAKDKYPICNICSIEVNYGQSKSTSKLSNHIFHQHRDVYDNYQSKEAAKKRRAVGTLEAFVVYGGDFMKEYIRWIVETFQPISTCDNPYFRRMCNAWSSRTSNSISAATVSKEMLKVKDQVMEAMKEFLVGQYFALTTDH